MWHSRNSYSLLGGMEIGGYFYKTKHTFTVYTAVVFLGIYPNELKTYVHTKTCTWMFITALFVTAKSWEQPRCPSGGEWINKFWYVKAIEYYSALIEMSYQAMKRLVGTLSAYY